MSADVTDAPLAAGDPPDPVGADAGAGHLRFRVLKRGPWRRAFRLEDEFWEALELAAARAGRKLADHIKAILDEDGAAGANASSVLRVRALAFLGAERERLLVGERQGEIVHAAIAAPVPCFVISASRALVSFNAEFSSYVMARAQASNPEEVGKARLALDVPIGKLIEVLSAPPGRVALCGFTIRTPQAAATGRARVTLIQPSRRDLVVGYVVPG